MIRILALLPLLCACGFVEDVGRTSIRLRELPFQVETRTGDSVARERPDLEQPVDLSDNPDIGGATELRDVRVEAVQVVVYENSLREGIERIQFIVAPVSIDTRAVFAAVADVEPGATEWPEMQIVPQGIEELAAFIADQHAPFLVQAAITFAVPEGYVTPSGGRLDLRLRIRASALAAR